MCINTVRIFSIQAIARVEEIQATFGRKITVGQVEKIVNELNQEWHKEIRRRKCQTTTE